MGNRMDREKQIRAVLKEHYNIHAKRIVRLKGGWSALAYLIADSDRKYFLKVYDKKRPSSTKWIDAIDQYMPIVEWLHGHATLKKHVVKPMLTNSEMYTCEDEQTVYLLSAFVDGYTIGSSPLKLGQVKEIAKILGTLHHSTEDVPAHLMKRLPRENFDIGFCRSLYKFIKNDLLSKHDAVLRTVKPFTSYLLDNIKRMKYLAETLKKKHKHYVLCHGDAHYWNMIQSKHIKLIDWECMIVAPLEQDLILHVTGQHTESFLSFYKRYGTSTKLDLDALEFYFLKRRLEAIWQWIEDLRNEEVIKSKEETLKLLKVNLIECTKATSFRAYLEANIE